MQSGWWLWLWLRLRCWKHWLYGHVQVQHQFDT
jgi:hypothetical protein